MGLEGILTYTASPTASGCTLTRRFDYRFNAPLGRILNILVLAKGIERDSIAVLDRLALRAGRTEMAA